MVRVRLHKQDGFALIDLIFVCGMIGLISSIAVPRLLLARQSASAASAIGSMRAINSAELSYAISCGSGFYAPKLTTLGTAPLGTTEPFVSPDLGSADSVTKSYYLIQLAAAPFVGAPPTCNGVPSDTAGRGYRAAADALEPNNTRFFATNSGGTIYEDTTSFFAVMPEYDDPAQGHILR